MGNVNFFSNGHTHNAYSNALDPNMEDDGFSSFSRF